MGGAIDMGGGVGTGQHSTFTSQSGAGVASATFGTMERLFLFLAVHEGQVFL